MSRRPHVIVLGTGWAGFRFLRDISIDKYDVSVISPRNHFLFTPLLTATTVGTLEFRGVIEPVRTARTRLNYVQASCVGIDFKKQQVLAESYYEQSLGNEINSPTARPRYTFSYDYLAIAVGAAPNTFGIPGVEKYCYFLRQLSDARAIRQRIIECFEIASQPSVSEEQRRRLLHFVVIGGGPTSVEFAAELHDFIKQDVHKWFPDLENVVQVTLVEASKKLLGGFDQRLSEYTMKVFEKRKIDVRVGVSVKEVQPQYIVLSDNSRVEFGLGVWSTGIAPIPLLKELPLVRHPSGRVSTDECLRVKFQEKPGDEPQTLENVFAVGDCAVFENKILAPTAQVAEQEGKYVAYRLNQLALGKKPEPFHYQHRGMLAYIGGFQALVDTPISKSSGFWSWIVWNAAYLTKLVSIRNKIMIPMYWFKSFVFGRDISRF